MAVLAEASRPSEALTVSTHCSSAGSLCSGLPTGARLPGAQSQKLDALRLNEAEMRRRFHIDLTSTTFTPNWLTSEAAEDLRASTDAHHLLEGEFQVTPPRRRRHATVGHWMPGIA